MPGVPRTVLPLPVAPPSASIVVAAAAVGVGVVPQWGPRVSGGWHRDAAAFAAVHRTVLTHHSPRLVEAGGSHHLMGGVRRGEKKKAMPFVYFVLCGAAFDFAENPRGVCGGVLAVRLQLCAPTRRGVLRAVVKSGRGTRGLPCHTRLPCVRATQHRTHAHTHTHTAAHTATVGACSNVHLAPRVAPPRQGRGPGRCLVSVTPLYTHTRACVPCRDHGHGSPGVLPHG